MDINVEEFISFLKGYSSGIDNHHTDFKRYFNLIFSLELESDNYLEKKTEFYAKWATSHESKRRSKEEISENSFKNLLEDLKIGKCHPQYEIVVFDNPNIKMFFDKSSHSYVIARDLYFDIFRYVQLVEPLGITCMLCLKKIFRCIPNKWIQEYTYSYGLNTHIKKKPKNSEIVSNHVEKVNIFISLLILFLILFLIMIS